MAKPQKPAAGSERQQFVLTAPVWLGEKRLPIGTVVSFENDEPTGVYRGRCKPVGGEVAQAAADGTDLAAAVARAEKAEADLAAAVARAEKAEADLAKVTPPTPPS